ncbi:hypothetical protein ACFXKF_36460 [Streptomyces scopuliridis]|uniref:hypothetical protein n=1 Tax=Streptomyces scopuliridis TaxID=452529 RepID=UPI0036C4BEEC
MTTPRRAQSAPELFMSPGPPEPPSVCSTCGDTGCRTPKAGPHVYCALCQWPHAEHHFVECATFTSE